MRSDLNFFLSLKSREQRHKWIIYLFVWILCCLFFSQYGSSFTRKKRKMWVVNLHDIFFSQTVMQRAFQCYTFNELLIQTSKILMMHGYAWNALKRGTMFVSVTDIIYFFFVYEGMIHVIYFLGLKYNILTIMPEWSLQSSFHSKLQRKTYLLLCNEIGSRLLNLFCIWFFFNKSKQEMTLCFENLDTNNW